MRKLLSVTLGVALAVTIMGNGSAAVSSVGDPGRSWTQPDDAQVGQHVQWFIDTFPNDVPSYLYPESTSWNPQDDPTCSSSVDSKCVGKRLLFSAVLPKCQTDSELNCTTDFGVIDADGKKTSAEFSRYFPARAQNEFKGDVAKNLPDGIAGSIYSLPSAIHDGGDKYYLSVALTGNTDSSGKAQKPNLEVRATPVVLEQSGYSTRSGESVDSGWARITDRNTGVIRWGIQAAGFSGNQYCVANSAKENLCAQKYAFPADTRFYVTLRLTQLPVGWMHGRISSPEIKITDEKEFSVLEIQGNPIAVPVVYKKYQYLEMPEALKKMYSVEKAGYIPTCGAQQDYCGGGRTGPSKDPLNRNVVIAPAPSSVEGMDQLKLWLPFVEDKATALQSFWSARTLSGSEMSGASSCFADSKKITGIVTSNSTQYSAGPPQFSATQGTLDYQVASPHFGSTGDVFKGTYDLVMRSDVARCLYGFSQAPIKATISITSSDGSPQLATTVIGERNNWLYLQARNFEFSAPVVKVKLTQKKNQKYTINCVKGSKTKKVTGTSPKCPSGYKKAA
jgi:hypothetical protein